MVFSFVWDMLIVFDNLCWVFEVLFEDECCNVDVVVIVLIEGVEMIEWDLFN